MREWELFLKELEATHPGSSTHPWTTSYKIKKFDAQNLYLQFSDIFAINFFKEHVLPHLAHFKNNNNHLIRIHIECAQDEPSPLRPELSTRKAFDFPLDPSLTLTDFICGEENKLILDLLLHLDDKTRSFNPFYIYGAKASGKSHLLMAACNHYTQKGLKCLYVTAEKFSEHVVYAMRHFLMGEFRETYRHIDILFLDNAHHLENKLATQEEFFHTFNSLHTAGKMIVVGAESPASTLKNIEPRLISRFEWGLSLELSPLTQAFLPQLLLLLKKQLELPLTPFHEKTLLESFQDPASLSETLHTLALRSHLDKTSTEMQIDKSIEELKTPQKQLTLDAITDTVATFFNLKLKDLKSPAQTRQLAFPRQIALYLIRKHLCLPYKKIGEYFDRDHSTIMASITLIENKLKTSDEETLNALKRIEWALKS